MTMKKMISLALAVCMALALAVPVGAVATESQNSGEVKTVVQGSYSFVITEQTDEYGRVTRTYHRDLAMDADDNSCDADSTIAGDANDNYAEVKALLLVLGMEQDFIDNLSSETLEELASSQDFSGEVSYVKSDAKGNTEIVDEQTALRGSAISNQGDISTCEQDVDTFDNYIRVFHQVTHQGAGKFLYVTDARWLNMPRFKTDDSIGSSAQNCTATPGTGSGWYSYTKTNRSNGTVSDSGKNVIKTSDKYIVKGDEGWVGSAAIVNIPEDDMDYKYKNFKAHYQYNGHITNTSNHGWFMSIGTYCHTKASATFSGISIQLRSMSLKGNTENIVGGLIGLRIGMAREAYAVPLEVEYNP